LPRRSKRKYLAFGCENPIKKIVAIATHHYIFQCRKSGRVTSDIKSDPPGRYYPGGY
jgi:hypothetical protein